MGTFCMTTRTRVILTAAFGVVLGLKMWLGTEGFSPSPGLEGVFGSEAAGRALLVCLILVPLIVGRWWVLTALAGWVIASVVLQSTGHVAEGGGEDHWGLIGVIVGLALWGSVFLILVGTRMAFDRWRRRRAARKTLGRRPVVSKSSDPQLDQPG